MDPKALQRRLPLLWFDRLLRRFGPFLPLPVVALRLASDLVMLRGEQHRLAGLQSGRLQGHYTETAVVYLGVSVMRVLVYFLHCAGEAPCLGCSTAHHDRALWRQVSGCAWMMYSLPAQSTAGKVLRDH